MKRGIVAVIGRGIVFVVIVSVLVCCAKALSTTSDYDKQADFKKYWTYAFLDTLKKLPIDRTERRYIMQAVETEMALRGYFKSDTVDLLVDIDVNLYKRSKARQENSTYTIGGYSPGPAFTNQDVKSDLNEDGTLVINVIDPRAKKLVWQGRGVNTFSRKKLAEFREADLNYAVAMIFKKYPVKSERTKKTSGQ